MTAVRRSTVPIGTTIIIQGQTNFGQFVGLNFGSIFELTSQGTYLGVGLPSGVPTSPGSPVAVGSALADGTSANWARADHVHTANANVLGYTPSVPASWPVVPTTGQGALDELITFRLVPADTNPAAIALTAAPGVSAQVSRADHVHTADASLVSYSPLDPTDWLVTPALVDEGLDELASRTASIEQGLSGDVDGAFLSNTVTGLQTRALASSAPSAGQAIVWNNGASQWEPGYPTTLASPNLRGPIASRPAAGVSGRLYFDTDNVIVYFDTGAAWVEVLPSSDTYSMPKLGASVPATSRTSNVTTGMQFTVGQNCTCVGIRFYWASSGGAKTIRCKLWPNLGAQLASVDVAVNASGIYEGYFASAVTGLTAANNYRASAWDTLNTVLGVYTAITQTNVAGIIPRTTYWGAFLVPQSITQFGNGDAIPTSTAATEFYCVEPILVPA